jgi:diaminopropionate ammonia-lyase
MRYENQGARAWRTPHGAGPDAATFHRTLPGYAPTPLRELPELAAELGIGRLLVKDESARLGLPAFKILGASYAVSRALSARFGEPGAQPLSGLRLLTATDGNHGRAVARVARELGLAATVLLPAGVNPVTVAALHAEGVDVRQLDLPYDEVVAAAAALAGPDALLVQDTAWPGYEEIPQWIVDGYATLCEEIDAALAGTGALPAAATLDLVVVPAGVGSLAQAVVEHYRRGGPSPAVLVVEPDAAPAVTTALLQGRPVPVPTRQTVMTGLNCGTVSELAWPVLAGGLDAAVTVSDAEARAAVADLRAAGVDAGPCGAATLAGLRRALADGVPLGLGAGSVVVLLNTEALAANPLPEDS